MRILVIDDSKTTRQSQRFLLNQLGHEDIEEAKNGLDALSKVKVFKPDLILVDWNMPTMDGLSFIKAFRERNTTTPVIMVTTEGERSRVIEAIKAGVNNYVLKPYRSETLAERINETLESCGLAIPLPAAKTEPHAKPKVMAKAPTPDETPVTNEAAEASPEPPDAPAGNDAPDETQAAAEEPVTTT